MRSPRRNGVAFIVLCGAVLAFGLSTLRLIPFYEPFWGLDLHNVFAYHHCDLSGGGLYGTPGDVCGDVLGRDFLYPPAMFWWMAWVRWPTFGHAVSMWNVVTTVAMLAVGAVWLRIDHRLGLGWRTVALVGLWLGLLTQFPFVFALERGNNDVIPVVLWTAAAALYAPGRAGWSGGLAGVAVASKVYPAVALLVVVAGALRSRARTAMVIIGGAAAGGIAASALWSQDTWKYLTDVLPAFAARTREVAIISHAIDSLPAARGLVVVVGAALLGVWVVAAWSRFHDAAPVVFAGALAISTYFSTTSWDYNLITTYPLILLVAARGLERGGMRWRVATLALLASVVAGRGVFSPVAQLIFQLAALALAAMLVAWSPAARPSTDSEGAVPSTIG